MTNINLSRFFSFTDKLKPAIFTTVAPNRPAESHITGMAICFCAMWYSIIGAFCSYAIYLKPDSVISFQSQMKPAAIYAKS